MPGEAASEVVLDGRRVTIDLPDGGGIAEVAGYVVKNDKGFGVVAREQYDFTAADLLAPQPVEERGVEYRRSDLAEDIIGRLEPRETEAKETLDRLKAKREEEGTPKSAPASPAELVAYTEKRIYREAILAVADSDYERFFFATSTQPVPSCLSEEGFGVQRYTCEYDMMLPDPLGSWVNIKDLTSLSASSDTGGGPCGERFECNFHCVRPWGHRGVCSANPLPEDEGDEPTRVQAEATAKYVREVIEHLALKRARTWLLSRRTTGYPSGWQVGELGFPPEEVETAQVVSVDDLKRELFASPQQPVPDSGEATPSYTLAPPMPRSREELVEALKACVRLHEADVPLPGLGSDLTEVIEFLDSLEEREELRVLGENHGGVEYEYGTTKPLRHLPAAESWAAESRELGWTNVRIQRRSVTETPWTDVEEGTGGC